jgi:hypothetical protein
VVIAKSLTDEYLDLCDNIGKNETIFARYPYKIFLLIEAAPGGKPVYFLEMQYKKGSNLH